MFASAPNLADLYAFAIAQGVPVSDFPSGALTTVSIDTSGAITAANTTGIVAPGMVLSDPLGTALATWATTSGTVAPIPTAPFSAPAVQVYAPYIAWALNYALDVALPGPGNGAGLSGFAGQYTLAVYNLALHQIIKIAPDQPNQNFFSAMRSQFKLGILLPGVVMASGDQATSETLVVPEFFQHLTLSDLDLLKTPYGRDYMAYAQMYGPNIVGVS